MQRKAYFWRMLSLLYIILGLCAVVWGADKFTDGAASIARRLDVPQIVVGLTVVAFGTSLPELCVSLVSAADGADDIAVGNVVGSNIFNALLIVGCAAAVRPMRIQRSTVRKDIPFALVSSLVLGIMCLDDTLSRFEGLLLLVGFGLFMAYTLHLARQGSAEEGPQPYGYGRSLFFIVVGIACLVVGSRLFVSGAVEAAHRLHISEAVIGLTVVAGGTSLPELATSIVAARKGQGDIAIGNVLGSVVFNTLFILGLTGIILPLHIAGLTPVDWLALIGSMFLLWGMSYTRYTLERWEGYVLVALFLAYLAWLIVNATQGVWG